MYVRLPTPWEWYMLGKNHIFVSFPPHLGIVNNFYYDFTKDETSDFTLLHAVSIRVFIDFALLDCVLCFMT